MDEKAGLNSWEEVSRLILPALAVGITAGCLASLYRLTLEYADDLRETMFAYASSPLRWLAVIAAVAIIGLVVVMLASKEPVIMGGGVAQFRQMQEGKFNPGWAKVMVKRFAAGALCIVSGLSLGRGGPSVHLGALASQGILERFKLSEEDGRSLIVCGACAGLSAAFSAPLAGMLFTLELIHKQFRIKSTVPMLVSTLGACAVSYLLFGAQPLVSVVSEAQIVLNNHYIYLIIGVVMGVVGSVFVHLSKLSFKAYSNVTVPNQLKMLLPFLVAGVIGRLLPGALGCGYSFLIDPAIFGYGVYTLAAIFVGRFLFFLLCFSSLAPGGLIFPLLTLGAVAGMVAGAVCIPLLGLQQEYLKVFMMLGMAGMFASVVRTPLTAIILVAEITGAFPQLYGLAVVACISWLTACFLRSRPIFD